MARHATTFRAGTEGYRAPEIGAGGLYSPASDRFALGGLAYYVLTGSHPPPSPNELRANVPRLVWRPSSPETTGPSARAAGPSTVGRVGDCALRAEATGTWIDPVLVS